MTRHDGAISDQDSELDAVIAAYLEAFEAGQRPDQLEWLARYPHLADKLAEFFAADDQLRKAAGPPGLAPTGPFVPLTCDYSGDLPKGPPPHPLSLHPAEAAREPIGPGTLLAGRYRVFGVKAGGMGVVYLAEDIRQTAYAVGRKVAIKTVRDFGPWREERLRRQARLGRPVAAEPADYADLLVRFHREALAWVRLGWHENIVCAWWVIEIGAKPYLIVSYADSGNLADWIAGGRVTLPLALNFARQFCAGMKHAVRVAGMVHRDIKPENTLIHDGRVLKISDFGLARAFRPAAEEEPAHGDADGDPDLSRGGGGTKPYMPPEQFESLALADTRSDIFSFGAVLFEMLTSQRAFGKMYSNDMEADGRRVPLVHEVRPGMPPALSEIVARCLQYKPEDRYQSFEELDADLAKSEASLPERVPVPTDPASAVGASLTPSLQAEGEAYSSLSLGRYREAVAAADRGIALDPENHAHWVNKSKALIELQDWQAAGECCRRAIELKYDFAISWANLAWVRLSLGDAQDGLEAAERAIALDAQLADAWMACGCCLREIGRLTEARASFEKTIVLGPHMWKAHSNLAFCLLEMGRHAEALGALKRAVQINPQDPGCWWQIAWLQARALSWEEALRSVDKCLDLDPKSADGWVLRGWCLWSGRHDAAAAMESLNRARKLDPNNPRLPIILRAMGKTP